MYYLSLLFSVPCLVLTCLAPFMEAETRFFRYYSIPKAWFCIVVSFIFVVVGIIKDEKEIKEWQRKFGVR